jgi:hypothetical protein
MSRTLNQGIGGRALSALPFFTHCSSVSSSM